MNKLKILLFIFLCTSCYRVSKDIKPKVDVLLEKRLLEEKKSTFSKISILEKDKPWANEYIIGINFAKNLELYRAVTSFERAKILIPQDNTDRIKEIDYNIILCYYLGKKYNDVIEQFEKSSLFNADKSFIAFEDLLIILYESYIEMDNVEKANKIKKVLKKLNSNTEEKLNLSNALSKANISKLEKLSNKNKELIAFLKSYNSKKKSITKAQFLNATIPGTGYLYLGQKKACITSILLNSFFIWASYEFFKRGFIAAGIITTSFEMGWYFGGIYGAGEEAKFYNERIYNIEATSFMNKNKLFPIFMLKHTF